MTLFGERLRQDWLRGSNQRAQGCALQPVTKVTWSDTSKSGSNSIIDRRRLNRRANFVHQGNPTPSQKNEAVPSTVSSFRSANKGLAETGHVVPLQAY